MLVEFKTCVTEQEYFNGNFEKYFADTIYKYLNKNSEKTEYTFNYQLKNIQQTLLEKNKKINVVAYYYSHELAKNFYVEKWDFNKVREFKNGNIRAKTIFTIDLYIEKVPIFENDNFIGNIYHFYLEEDVYNKINRPKNAIKERKLKNV